MKLRKLIACLFCLWILLSLVGSCATGKSAALNPLYQQHPDEVLFGVWVNPDYDVPGKDGKIVSYAWGFIEAFTTISSERPAFKGTTYIVQKWTDESMNVWYKVVLRWENNPNINRYYLYKINPDGKIWELIWRLKDFPSLNEFDPEDKNYYEIYYRQQK